MISVAQPATRVERILADAQRGIVGVLFALKDQSNKRSSSATLAIAATVFDAVNILSFPLDASLGWSNMPSLAWLQTALNFRNPLTAVVSNEPHLRPAIVAGVLSLLTVLTGCLVYSVHGFATGTFKSVRPLQVLRVAARLAVIIQITVIEQLASVFSCDKEMWSSSTIACGSVEYALLVAATCLLLLVFVSFSFTVTSVFFNRNYGAPVLTDGRVHGRVEGTLLVVRIILTFIFSGKFVPSPIRLVAVIISGVIFFYSYARFLPEVFLWRNIVKTSVGALFLWSSVCAIPALLLSANSPWRPSIGLVFAVGVPGALILGLLVVKMRASQYAARVISLNLLRTPFDAELLARFALQAAGVVPQSKELREGGVSVAPLAPAPSASSDPEAAIVIERVRSMLNRATYELFPSSAMMALLHINLLSCFPALSSPEVARALLDEGFERRPVIDVYFLLTEETNALDARNAREHGHSRAPPRKQLGAAAIATTKLLALDDVWMGTTRARLCAAILKCATAEAHFWSGLRDPSPSSTELIKALEVFSNSAEAAAYSLERLSRFFSSKRPELTRLRAMYHLVVEHDSKRAMATFSEAKFDESFRFSAAANAQRAETVAGSAAADVESGQSDAAPSASSAVVLRAIARSVAIAREDTESDSANESMNTVWDAWTLHISLTPLAVHAKESDAAALAFSQLAATSRASTDSSTDDGDASSLVPGISHAGAIGALRLTNGHAPFYWVLRLAIIAALALTCGALIASSAVQIIFTQRIASATGEILASSHRSSLAERLSRDISNAALYSSGLLAADAYGDASRSLKALHADASALYAAHSSLITPPPLDGFSDEENYLLSGLSLSSVNMIGDGLNATERETRASLSTIVLQMLTATDAVSSLPPLNASLMNTADAFFVTRNARGILREGMNRATSLIGARGKAVLSVARLTIVYSAVCFSIIVSAGAAIVALVSIVFFAGTESLLGAALASDKVKEQARISVSVLAALRKVSGSSQTFRSLLKDAALAPAELEAATALVEECAVASGGVAESRGTSRLRHRLAARARNALFFSLPLMAFGFITLVFFFVADSRLKMATDSHVIASDVASIRAGFLAAGVDARSALIEGLSPQTWSILPIKRGSQAPACDTAALAIAAAALESSTLATETTFRSLSMGPREGGSTPLINLSPMMSRILFSPICTSLTDIGSVGSTETVDAAPLGLPPLLSQECSTALPSTVPGADGRAAQPPGAFQGLGANGLLSLVTAYGVRLRAMLPTRAASLLKGAACAIPLSAASPAASLNDAAGLLLVDGGLKATLTAISYYQRAAVNDVVATLTTLAVIVPVLATVAFSLILSPILKRSDAVRRNLARSLLKLN
jgi:hypothetical protein